MSRTSVMDPASDFNLQEYHKMVAEVKQSLSTTRKYYSEGRVSRDIIVKPCQLLMRLILFYKNELLRNDLDKMLEQVEILSFLKELLDLPQNDKLKNSDRNDIIIRVIKEILDKGSKNFSTKFIELDLHEKMIGYLSEDWHDTINASGLNSALQCCYYCMKRNQDSIIEMRKLGLVEKCKRIRTEIPLYQVHQYTIIFVMSYAADLDADPEALKATKTKVHNILYYGVRDALTTPNHQSMHMSCFNAEESLVCLSRLVLNTDHAQYLISQQIIEECNKVIQAKFSEGEIQMALEILWTLCFQPNSVNEINTKSNLLPSVKLLKESKNDQISRAAKGILFQLAVENGAMQKAVNVFKSKSNMMGSKSEPDAQGHVMISYSWKQKEVARELAERLKHSDGGRRVWLDIEKMEGNILERMAEGVEGASVVVCCYSESYKNSQACRSEAEYAFKLNKHIIYVKTQQDYSPNGWLGIMMGNDLYYEATNLICLEATLAQIVSRINNLYMSIENQSLETEKTTQSLSSSTETQTSTSVFVSDSKPDVISWNANQVAHWISTLSLNRDITSNWTVKQLDGEILTELRLWQTNAPDLFWKFCQHDLGMDFSIDILIFSKQLRQLIR